MSFARGAIVATALAGCGGAAEQQTPITSAVSEATYQWVGTTGPWGSAPNWSGGAVPGADNQPGISNGGTATLTATRTAKDLVLGEDAETSGTLQLSGALTIRQNLVAGGAGTGHITQTAGSLTVGFAPNVPGSVWSLTLGQVAGGSGTYARSGDGNAHMRSIFVGDGGSGLIVQTGTGELRGDHQIVLAEKTDSAGEIELADGSIVVGTADAEGTEYIGARGTGIFTQTGGTNAATWQFLGRFTGAVGTYTLSGGTNTVTRLRIGEAVGASGTFTHTGGTNTATEADVGVAGVGAYTLSGPISSLFSTTALRIGPQGTFTGTGGNLHAGAIQIDAGGTLSLGNASATTRIDPAGAPGTIAVGGTLVGWGNVSLAGALTVSGHVIADGRGAARVLNLSTLARAEAGTAPASGAGYYARNGGRLSLRRIALASGERTYTWGAGEGPLSLVNSMRLELTASAPAQGTITLALVDPAAVTSWPSSTSQPLALWTVTANPATTLPGAAVSIRYDDAAFQATGDTQIRIWTYDGTWRALPTVVDSAARVASATIGAGVTQIVVASDSANGALSVSGSSAVTGGVNLTAEGTVDWTHWGLGGSTDLQGGTTPVNRNQKLGADGAPVGIIGDLVASPASALRTKTAPNAYPAFSWSDGTPTLSATTPSSAYVIGAGSAMSIAVQADATPKTLVLYLSGFRVRGTLTATLSDGSAAAATFTQESTDGFFFTRLTLPYRAATPNARLDVTWASAAEFPGTPDQIPNVKLTAAAVQ